MKWSSIVASASRTAAVSSSLRAASGSNGVSFSMPMLASIASIAASFACGGSTAIVSDSRRRKLTSNAGSVFHTFG